MTVHQKSWEHTGNLTLIFAMGFLAVMASERNHCRQRHWCGRCKRKSIIVSQSTGIMDRTMTLYVNTESIALRKRCSYHVLATLQTL